MTKLVSIVLPTYNGSRFIEDSVKSVLCQTYTNWEMIIVNDCSTDNTPEIIEGLAKLDSRIRIINNEVNKKLPESLNIGFADAKGDYLTWTSDDNMFKNNALEYMVNYLDNNPNVDLISCNFDFINEDGSFEREFSKNIRIAEQLALGCNIGACFMYRKGIAQKVGKYDKQMFCAEDYDYWCRIALVGNIAYDNENLYLYRNNSTSLTATKQNVVQEKSNQIRLKYSLKIMDKCKLTKKQKVEILIKNYNKTGDLSWWLQGFRISLFNMLYSYLKPKLEVLALRYRLAWHIKFGNKRIVLWGASLFLEDFFKNNKIYNDSVIGIIDKNSAKAGSFIGEYKIYEPNELAEISPQEIIVTITNFRDKRIAEVKEYVKSQRLSIKVS